MEPSSTAAEELAILLQQENPAVDVALLLMSEAIQDDSTITPRAVIELDALADEVRSAAVQAGNTKAPSVADIVDTLFVEKGFAGDIEHYHDAENSFLESVLERRTGMPITLSTVVVGVGTRLGMDLYLVGLPGHVVVGIPDEATGEFTQFIDAFSGALVDRAGLAQRLASIFGQEVNLGNEPLAAMSTQEVVARVFNNLMRTWSGEPAKFDRLLDLYVAAHLDSIDPRMVIETAKARSRFDLAAKLRERQDPTDPEVKQLWARLN